MYEFGHEHPVTYRQELARPLFDCIRQASSAAIIGAGNMGKTRLIDFIMRKDVQDHYLEKDADKTLLLRADLNRMGQLNEWSLYEVMLTAIVEGCTLNPISKPYLKTFNNDLRRDVVLHENALLAQRSLELAVKTLVESLGLRICFLLDEFEPVYQKFSPIVMANLRALRDQNKNRFCYLLFLRNAPETLRDCSEVESFYELHSSNLYGLKPYTELDTELIISQLEERNHIRLDQATRKAIVGMSAGHPGFLYHLVHEFPKQPGLIYDPNPIDQILKSEKIERECQKLLSSLPGSEQAGLSALVHGRPVGDDVLQRLMLKGLVVNDGIFSKIFERYLQRLS